MRRWLKRGVMRGPLAWLVRGDHRWAGGGDGAAGKAQFKGPVAPRLGLDRKPERARSVEVDLADENERRSNSYCSVLSKRVEYGYVAMRRLACSSEQKTVLQDSIFVF